MTPVDIRELVDDRAMPKPEPHPFAIYCQRVLKEAEVPNAQETRELASAICGMVAKLPFLVDDHDEQAQKIAARAEAELESPMVWGDAAVKIAKVAVDLRHKGEAPVVEPIDQVAARTNFAGDNSDQGDGEDA